MTTLVKCLAAAFMAVAALPALAAASGDTLVIEGVSKVKIETRANEQRIVINGSKEDPQLHYVQRVAYTDTISRKLTSVKDFNKVEVAKTDSATVRKVDFSQHVKLGLGTMTGAPDNYDFKLWPSVEIGIAAMVDWHPFGLQNTWSIGFGIDLRHYRIESSHYFGIDGAGMLTPLPYADNQTDRRTTLVLTSLQVPVLYKHRFDRDGKYALTLGAIVNFNTGARSTRRFNSGGERFSIKTQSLGQRPVTIDGLAVLRTSFLPDLYFKYSPTTPFKDGRAPKMHQLSFGIWF